MAAISTTIPVTPAATNFLSGETIQRDTSKSLGVDEFLKLLTTQLTAQDPLKPMEDTQFISQMANFTSLEQMRALSKNFEAFTQEQRFASAQSYLGKTVTIGEGAGAITGSVSAVTMEDDGPRLTIGEKTYDPAEVTSVRAAAAAAAAASVGSAPTAPAQG